MHRLDKGDDKTLRVVGLVELSYDPLGNNGRSSFHSRDSGDSTVGMIRDLIERGDIDAFDL